MSRAISRPEPHLRRARDFETSGNKLQALRYLYTAMAARNMGRHWNAAHEAMMFKFVELCVEFREARLCIEGLNHYNYLESPDGNPPIENTIRHLMKIAVDKCNQVHNRIRSHQSYAAPVNEDEEQESTLELMMLNSVSVDGTRERIERETLMPWVKFVCDCYRNVIDLVSKSPVLDKFYHELVIEGSLFLKKYNRSMEFKKIFCVKLSASCKVLVENMRAPKNVPVKEENIIRQISTRLHLLELCCHFSFWQEALDFIQQISEILNQNEILNIAKLQQHPIMTLYYEKLHKMSLISGNSLFHAYAWIFLADHLLHLAEDLTPEQRMHVASAVALSALSIPVVGKSIFSNDANSGKTSAENALEKGRLDESIEKTFFAPFLRSMTNLTPSRDDLFANPRFRTIVRLAHPQVAGVFKLMECGFSPLTLIHDAAPFLNAIENIAPLADAIPLGFENHKLPQFSLGHYIPQLKNNFIFRTVQLLQVTYSSITTSFLKDLISPLQVPYESIEKSLVGSAKQRLITLRIDHKLGVINLDNESVDDPTTRKQLAELGYKLTNALQVAYADEQNLAVVPLKRRNDIFAAAAAAGSHFTLAIQNRGAIVEERLRESRRATEEEEKARLEALEAEARRRQAAEEEHNAMIAAQREKEAAEQMQRKIMVESRRKLAITAGIANAENLPDDEILAYKEEDLLRKSNEKANKAKNAEARLRQEAYKRLQYFVRALIQTERPVAQKALMEDIADTEAAVNKFNEELEVKEVRRAVIGSHIAERLDVVLSSSKYFADSIVSERKKEFEKKKALEDAMNMLSFLKRKRTNALNNKMRSEEKRDQETAARQNVDIRLDDRKGGRPATDKDWSSIKRGGGAPKSSDARVSGGAGLYRPFGGR